ncbi:MAG: hypothetical protein MUE58_01595 [Chitinophagaceae bacterium]|jgi:hypothetical protein|nr:hypothetical protein [Chitinophagaceae bacterium]
MEPSQNTPGIPAGPARPTLLTVLCILSFIGGVYGIINGLTTYRHAETSSAIVSSALDSAQVEIKKEAADNKKASQIADSVISGVSDILDPAKMKKNALYTILANILTLGGAYLMFQLKKPGFWLYLAGTAVAVLAPIMVYGATNIMSIGMSAVIGFFGILFAVLYSLNLKYMK